MGALLTRWRTVVWVLPAVLLLLVFVYYPIADNLRLSLFSWNAFSPEPRFVGLDNYAEAFGDPVFWRALLNNVAYAVVSLVCQAGVSLVLAALLEELVGRRLRGLLRTLYFIPAATSITVAGVLFSFLYNPRYGLVNEALQAVGLGHLARAWIGEEGSAIWSVIAMSQWQGIGYTAVLFVVAIQRIPR
uniref:carbohydrate ABC transporter permease n=1 Tax=Nonomuraea pusilla TaxID=46177 RepID=UPI000A9EC437|nr:sugar ABC transporter permease [Nonomuraea pusilla]